MKYLDEDIVLSLGNRSEGYHNYELIINHNYEDSDPDVIYNGRFYIAPGKNSIEIDVTDILSTYRYLYKLPTNFEGDPLLIKSVNQVAGPDLITTVTLRDTTQADGRYNIISETVCFMYRYPNANYTNVYDAYERVQSDYYICPMLQSSVFYESSTDDDNIEHVTYAPKYLPRYPLMLTSNYGVISSLLFNRRHSDEITYLLGETVLWTTNIEEHYKGSYDMYFSMKGWLKNISDLETIYDTTIYYADMSRAITYYGISTDYTFYGDITFQERLRFLAAVRNFFGDNCADAIEGTIFNGNLSGTIQLPIGANNTQALFNRWNLFVDEYIPMRPDDPDKPIISFSNTRPYEISTKQLYPAKTPLATLDKCPAEYYLMWQDRMGGIQSQPLRNKAVYSESINQTTMTSYQNHKRPINAEIQPEWELMTEWIDDEYYPIWESLFTSAYILLYNTKLDKNYRVIAVDKTFTQKTNRNQKNLFKHTIKLQLDKPQNIIS